MARETRRTETDELLAAVERANRYGGATADVADELGVTTARARSRLRTAERNGLVDSFRPDPIFCDRETYWRPRPDLDVSGSTG